MHFLPQIFFAALVIIAVVSTWFASDMRSILKSGQRKNQLSIEGRWQELDQHFEITSKPGRPFVWLHQRYLLPGAVAAQHALFLFNQGRLEEALVKANQAVRQVKGKPWVFRTIHHASTFKILLGSLSARTMILTGLGRYDEAREAAAQLQRLAGAGGRPNTALALLEYYSGHVDEALALAQAVPPEDPQYDAMRGIAAIAQVMKGEYSQAVQTLLYEPGDMTKFYSPAGLKAVREDPEGPKLIELQNKKLAGVFQPARLLLLANVYLAQEDFENANRVIDQAEKKLGPEPGIQASYCRYRACCLAAQGKAKEAENHLERMRAIVKQLPKRSLIWETHFTAGRSYLYLGRPGDALAELIEAQRSVLHPTEKHVTTYWIARAHEAAGNPREAVPYYQSVAADTIPSWMRKKAIEALA
jgi:tetratricopeptide (TPR) repeat protein